MVKLPKCHKCKSDSLRQVSAQQAECSSCLHSFELSIFPATFGQGKTGTVETTPVFHEGESTCFDHSSSLAVATCHECGRFLCSLCTVESGELIQCLDCFVKAKETTNADRIIRWDQVLPAMSILPILIWPFTIFTAPAVLILTFLKGKNPENNPLPYSRISIAIAFIFALIQVVFWGLFIVGMATGGLS